MIKHIVMFKLTDFEDEEDKRRKVNQIKEVFGSLRNKIKEIASYEVGINFNPTETAYDLIINSEFKTFQDLDGYVHHVEHQEAIETCKGIAKIKAVVDYEI